MRYEPKGVVGNMAPWNFPFEIGCGPVVEMLAAGNRVMIKPSDLTPACGTLLAELVAATFDRDHVDVAVGGLELAKAFPRRPWDHLLYTGSPAIGREVMRAAADHLVPVTLELGGKCPAVLTPSGRDDRGGRVDHRDEARQERPDVHHGRPRARAPRAARRVSSPFAVRRPGRRPRSLGDATTASA